MAETIWVRGSGGAIFELDVTERVRKKLKSGELVVCDPPPKKMTSRQRAAEAAKEAETAEAVEAEAKDTEVKAGEPEAGKE